MSYQAQSRRHHQVDYQNHQAGHHESAPPRMHRTAHPQHPELAAGYTLGHGRRQVRLGPVAFWTAVGTVVIMASWSIITATYFAFHDDVLMRLVSRQAEIQFAYEDRIADLRAQIDRVTSRQLLDQEQFERKLDTLLRRQTTIESRAAAIGSLAADPTPTGSIKPPIRGSAMSEPLANSLKPSPINDKIIFIAPPDREARLESRRSHLPAIRHAARAARGGIEGTLSRLQESIEHAEMRQTKTLTAIEEGYDHKTRRMRNVLSDLGLDVSRLAPTMPASSTGGPFVPARLSDNGAFERQLHRIHMVRMTADRLHRKLVAVPVRKPVAGDIDSSSGFGVRMDPFLRSPAMHTGLDIRGNTGEPVRATANGTVTVAGLNGGYGKMIEIDHGNGFSTRYGHLSSLDVEVGDKVRVGQIVGRVGSTGRSTGPHLHYETRVDGDAVDPQKFLRAGIRLGNL